MKVDLRLDIGFVDHPKTRRLSQRLGGNGIPCLLRLWSFAAVSRKKGVLTDCDVHDIAFYSRWNGDENEFLRALIEIGFLDEIRDENGAVIYALHDWEVHQPWIYGADERSEKASKNAKIKHKKDRARRMRPAEIPQSTPQCETDARCIQSAEIPHCSDSDSDSDSDSLSSRSKSEELKSSPPADAGSSAVANHPPPGEVRAFVEAWNRLCVSLPKCESLTAKRRTHIRVRLRDRPLAEWEEIFQRIENTPFLRGENDRGWRASIDWVIRSPDSAAGVLEGKYDQQRAPPKSDNPFAPGSADFVEFEQLKEAEKLRGNRHLC